jgi:hypothetical protein
MVSHPQARSFLTANKTCPKNCAAYKNCAKCWETYPKSLVITKKYRLRPNLYTRFIKEYLRLGKIKIQESIPLSVKNFSRFFCPKPGFAQLLGFTMSIRCGKNKSQPS